MIDGTYRIKDGSTATIRGGTTLETTFTGTNTLRGGLNIFKKVVDETGNIIEDDDSTFQVKVELTDVSEDQDDKIWFDTYEVDSAGAIVKPTADELTHWLNTTDGKLGESEEEARDGNEAAFVEQVAVIDADNGIYKNADGVLYGVNGKSLKYADETNYIGEGGYGSETKYISVLDLKASWMIRIVNILSGAHYEVTETNTNGMVASYEHWHDNSSSTDKVIIGNTSSNIRITNKLVKQHVIVYKTDMNNVPLEGAVFTINGETLTSGNDGYTAVIDLPVSGDPYDLTETTPPDGYIPLTVPVIVNVSSGGVTYKQENFDGGNLQTAERDKDGNYVIHVRNNPGVILPSTGSFGTLPILAAGAVLMAGSATALALAEIRRRRREEE